MLTNFTEQLNSDITTGLETLKSSVINEPVTCTKYGTGTITDVDFFVNNNTANILFTITFADQIKKFAFQAFDKFSFIKYSEKTLAACNEALSILTAYTAAIAEQNLAAFKQAEADRIKREEEAAAEKKQQQLKLKFEQTRNRVIAAANKLKPLSPNAGFFAGLGYVAKHAKSITAAMPDYLDNWFISNFGDIDHNSVDSNKLTAGGNTMQWTLSLAIKLDTNECIPASLNKYLGNTKNDIQPISNTEYVFTLLKDYGFVTGKKQNIDEIRKHIPESELENFEFGYALGA